MSPSEPARALLALEWLLAFVYEHVSLELVGVGELARAVGILAVVRSLTGVHPQVAPQVGHLHELSLAVSAVVRLLSGMQPHVSLEMVVPSEPLMTFAALERLLSGVRPLVVLEHMFVAKTPVTYGTHKHFFAPRSCPCSRTGGWAAAGRVGGARLWSRFGRDAHT